MKTSKIPVILAFMALLLLILILYIFLFSPQNQDNLPQSGRPSTTDTIKSGTGTISALDTIKFNGKDSVRLTDENTLLIVNRYLKRYSELNISGDVKEYLKLYKCPVLIGNVSFDDKALANFATRHFANTKTVRHYFEYTKVFARNSKEFIVYTRENQDYTDLVKGKYLSIMADKRFVLQKSGDNIFCTDMQMLTFVKK